MLTITITITKATTSRSLRDTDRNIFQCSENIDLLIKEKEVFTDWHYNEIQLLTIIIRNMG